MKHILLASLVAAISLGANAAPINKSKIDDTAANERFKQKIIKQKGKISPLQEKASRKQAYIDHHLHGSEEVPLTEEEIQIMKNNKKMVSRI